MSCQPLIWFSFFVSLIIPISLLFFVRFGPIPIQFLITRSNNWPIYANLKWKKKKKRRWHYMKGSTMCYEWMNVMCVCICVFEWMRNEVNIEWNRWYRWCIEQNIDSKSIGEWAAMCTMLRKWSQEEIKIILQSMNWCGDSFIQYDRIQIITFTQTIQSNSQK